MEDGDSESWVWLKEYLGDYRYGQIIGIRQKVEDALSNNIPPNFTDHSARHCDRVIDIIGKLVEDNLSSHSPKSLNREELIVLALSVLFHDLGMHLPNSHGFTKPITDFTIDDYNKMRRDHGEVSGAVVRDIADGTDKVLQLGSLDDDINHLLPTVAFLCERHQSSSEYRPEEIVRIGPKELRVGLLTSLLRLSDELDCDYRRVDMNKLNQYGIPITSVFHWLNCSYVDSVTIKGGVISIQASYHSSLTGPEANYLSQLLIDKISSEYRKAENVLWDNNIKLRMPTKVDRTGTDFSSHKLPLPTELLDKLRENLTETKPTHLEVSTSGTGKFETEEVDWMSYWKLVGNPFVDIPVAYGTKKYVQTKEFKRLLSEVGSFLKGTDGELKLLIGPRGMGKTSFFQSINSQYAEKFDIFIVDVADKLPEIHSVGDLNKMIFYSIYQSIKGKDAADGQADVIEAARLGNKKVICVDSLDRLPEDHEKMVIDFFKGAQNTLSKLRTTTVVIFACSEEWGKYLISEELSYMGYRNRWELLPFTSEDIEEMLARRLVTCGRNFTDIFSKGCSAIFRNLSKGNPRQSIILAEAICRYGAQKKQAKITPEFIHDQYQKEFDKTSQSLIDRLSTSNSEFKNGITYLYYYYLEMERRGLDTRDGWNYLIELMEKGLPYHRIQGQYIPALKFVATSTIQLKSDKSISNKFFAPLPQIKSLFKALNKEGYSVTDFIMFYSTKPMPPTLENNELEFRLKSALLEGEDLEYFVRARDLFVSVRRSSFPPFQIISNAWDCLENMMLAILLKANSNDAKILIAKSDDWFVEDKYGAKRFVRGAGKLRSDYAKQVVSAFMTYLRGKGIWLSTFASLDWIKLARGNVVRGRTEYLSQFGEREKELCLKHLDAVFKELMEIYG